MTIPRMADQTAVIPALVAVIQCTRVWVENFSLVKFPEIARAALDERSPARQVDLAALVRDFLLSDEHDRPLDLACQDRLRIAILNEIEDLPRDSASAAAAASA